MKKNKKIPKGIIGGKKVCIFDLEFMQYLYNSRARPGMYPMLISSFYKNQGYQVVFTTEVPNFQDYEIVFINRDAPDLWYDPEWLGNDNVKLTGAYWPSNLIYYPLEWESVDPDITIFHNWVENRLKKYPSLKKARFDEFYKTPFKIIRGNKIVEPEGSHLLIVDDNLQSFKRMMVSPSVATSNASFKDTYSSFVVSFLAAYSFRSPSKASTSTLGISFVVSFSMAMRSSVVNM